MKNSTYNGWELDLWQRAGCKLFIFPWLIGEVEPSPDEYSMGEVGKKKRTSLLSCNVLCGPNRNKSKGKRGKVGHISSSSIQTLSIDAGKALTLGKAKAKE